MKGISDTGFLVAFANARDIHHGWALGVADRLTAPLLTGTLDIPMPPTDELGHTQKTFFLHDVAPGQLVILTANVRYEALTTWARTFFLVWW